MNQYRKKYHHCRFFQGRTLGFFPILALLALSSCLICFQPPTANASDTQQEVIRVGFPNIPGLSEIDKQGNYSGFTYDFLQEMAQYTGWEYEFVQLSGSDNEVLTKMYDMLAKGELDLMGDTYRTEELAKLYDYPMTNYGSVSSTLEVLEKNTSINDANYQTMNNMRIAVLKHAKKSIAALEDFCNNNHIKHTLVYCEKDTDLLKALQENRADALLYNNVAAMTGTRIVARFNAKPFYFATTKGNNKLISQINSAMSMLTESDPYFATTLYQKYFSRKTQALLFTDDEKNYIAQAPVFKVGIADNHLPIEDINEKGEFTGIAMDFLKIISDQTGLQFQPVAVQSPNQLFENLKTNQIDLALTTIYDYNTSQKYNFSMSKPYLSAQMIMATKTGINPYDLAGKRMAVPKGINHSPDFTGDIIWYNSIPECLEAVNKGEADYCYGNGFSVEYYCNLYQYKHLVLIPQSSQISQYSIGIARPTDPLLLTILNKTIRTLPAGKMQALIYQNSMPSPRELTIKDYIETHLLETFVAISLLALFIVGLMAYFAFFQKKARQKTQIENNRYQLLADLSGEYLFEYDFEADYLRLTEKTAKIFGTPTIHQNYYKEVSAKTDEDTSWIHFIYDNIQKQKNTVTERQVTLPDGRIIWLRITTAAMTDSKGTVNYIIGKITNIQTEKQEKDELSLKAQTDGLTGLYNISETKKLVSQTIAKAKKGTAGTLLIMDIDHFKSINDNFGHYTGDKVLQDVAKILQNLFREDDIIGRLGGDELVVFMKNANQKYIIEKKCRLLQKQMQNYSNETQIPVTLSIGAAICQGNIDYDTLYHSADNLLYTVKTSGRNGFHIAETYETDSE